MPETTLDAKLERMSEQLRSMGKVAVAFSAGVDSTFVLKVAVDVLGCDRVLAATGKSDSLAAKEFDQCVALAASLGVEHVVIETDEFDNPNYLANPSNRCYFCKTTLYERTAELAQRRGFDVVVNGTNADDLGDWRPGLAAADEFAVRSPAAEAGLTKQDIRTLSERMGLPTHDKPASPCLSSRVRYGEQITPEKLRMIESCEAFLHGLGMVECRVRHHGDLARIEVPPDQIARVAEASVREAIRDHFREAGYTYVTLDLLGFRSGSMNEVIAFGKRQSVS